MRIDKYLSNLKYGSRKELRKFIKDGYVKINNEVINSHHIKFNPKKDKVSFLDEEVPYYENINIMLNKPEGFLSANKDELHEIALSLITEPFNRYDLKIAGRLDLDSSGILILTTNGQFAHKLTSPNYKVNKVYEVILDKDISNYKELLKGVNILDGRNEYYNAKALDVKKIENKVYQITINEGKFHQVRRMFLYLGANVLKLKRIKYGKLSLNDLEEGDFKLFNEEDVL